MMQLNQLLDNKILPNTTLKGITADSRQVKPGYVFLAYRGHAYDGKDFIPQALQQGAAAIVLEGPASFEMQHQIPFVTVPELSKQIGHLAAKFFGFPSQQLKITGITGTSGKTSCCHFMAAALQTLQQPCGVIGTLGNGLYGNILPSALTTPDAITLQQLFSEFLANHVQYVTMEVSSHSIDQGRINGAEFLTAIFTNLSRDHLDYHGTMENYGAVKKRFFAESWSRYAVINADDEFGRSMIQELAPHKKIFSYSLDATKKIPHNVEKIYVDTLQWSDGGMSATIYSPWGRGTLTTSLLGQFNLRNVLAVFTALCLLDISFEKVVQAIASLTSVPGRMQTFGGQGQPLVVVDYAHKPDALEKVLQVLKQHCRGHLLCVFGCGGDRDRGKRPLMAAIAEQYADQVIVTSDNPRHENPRMIIDEITAGFSSLKNVKVEIDRAKAIELAIKNAHPNDCILIAGKGAECYQIIGDEKTPFCDETEVKRYLK